MSANDRQIGGDHYGHGKVKYQHWDVVVEHKLNYFEAQILRYVMRCRRKHGIVDLQKAGHMLEKYIEVFDLMRDDAMLPPAPPQPDLSPIEIFRHWEMEEAARVYLTREGYKNDHTLFKCAECRGEGWGLSAISDPVCHRVGCSTPGFIKALLP